LGALVLMLVFAACGSTSPTVARTATSTPTHAPTATATVDPSVVTACFGAGSADWQVTRVGDLLFARITLGDFVYESSLLPDGTPLTQPYKFTSTDINHLESDFANNPVTYPGLGRYGFSAGVCNVGATQHTLTSVSASIGSFTAFPGQINPWNHCNGFVNSHLQQGGTGCGGAMAGCMCFRAEFPATATTGAIVPTTQTDASLNSPGDGAGKLPLPLAPGKGLGFFVAIANPGTTGGAFTFTAGYYAFHVGVAMDGAAPTYSPNTSPAVLLGPVAHVWNGQNCTATPALAAQITATSPETYYICGK
jgi:hypothetical protein